MKKFILLILIFFLLVLCVELILLVNSFCFYIMLDYEFYEKFSEMVDINVVFLIVEKNFIIIYENGVNECVFFFLFFFVNKKIFIWY